MKNVQSNFNLKKMSIHTSSSFYEYHHGNKADPVYLQFNL